MILPSLAIDKYIVEEDEYKLPRNVLEDVVHQALEGTWRICKAERHYQIFVVTVVDFESCFVDIIL